MVRKPVVPGFDVASDPCFLITSFCRRTFLELTPQSWAAPVTDFDIFLSHNNADKGLVEGVAQTLQAEGLKPWLDKWCLVPGVSPGNRNSQ